MLIDPELKETNNNSSDSFFIVSTKLLGSFLIILSGIILYLDKIMLFFNYKFIIPEKFIVAGMNFQTFIWLISQTISPILLIIGAQIKSYHISYIVPLYCYALQLFFIFKDYKIIDDTYLYIYAIGSTFLVIIVIKIIQISRKKYLVRQIRLAKKKLISNE